MARATHLAPALLALFLAAIAYGAAAHGGGRRRYVRVVLAYTFVPGTSAEVMLGLLKTSTALPTQLNMTTPSGWTAGADLGIGGTNVTGQLSQADGVAVADFTSAERASALFTDPGAANATSMYNNTFNLTISAYVLSAIYAKPKWTSSWVRHAASFKFLDNVTEDQVSNLTDALSCLYERLAPESRPLMLTYGPAVMLEGAPASYLYNYSLVADFPDAASYGQFEQDPATQELVSSYLSPVMESGTAVQIAVNTP